jgi:hypothetical protein
MNARRRTFVWPEPDHYVRGANNGMIMRNSLFLLAGSIFVSGCMSLAIVGTWTDPGRRPDQDSWRTRLFPLGERDASLAIQNDDRSMRVVFTTTDPALRDRILKQGIYFWFDPNGGERRVFGIRYPVAWSALPVSVDGEPRTEEPSPGSPEAGWGKPGEDIEIYTDGYKEYERIGKKDAGGIDAQVMKFSDTLVCQIRVPLGEHPGMPYTLGAVPGDIIGVGVETRSNPTTGESISTLLPFQAWRKIQLARRP